MSEFFSKKIYSEFIELAQEAREAVFSVEDATRIGIDIVFYFAELCATIIAYGDALRDESTNETVLILV